MIETIVNGELKAQSPLDISFSPLTYLTKEEFNKWYWETLNTDSKKQNTTALSRTLTDSEAEKIKEHIWEYIQNNFIIDEDRLTLALLKTQRGYSNNQDRAKAIIKYLGFENV